MVGGDHEHVVLFHFCHKSAEPFIKFGKGVCISFRIVSVTVNHIEIHKVDEAKTFKILLLEFGGFFHSDVVGTGAVCFGNAFSGEDIKNLSDADGRKTLFHKDIKRGILRRNKGIIVASAGAVKIRIFTFKRSCNNSSDSVFALEERTGFFAKFIKFFKWNYILMCGNLENAVRGGINDGLSGFNMLFSEISDYLGSAAGFVAKDIKTCCLFEHIDNFLRKTFGICGESFFGNKSGKFPMSGGGVFSHAHFIKAAKCAKGFFCFFDGRNAFDISKTEAYHIGNIELSAGSAALEESYVVIWMDENSNSTCERFTLLVDIGDPKPWPVYVDELKQYGENEATIKIDLWGKQKNKGVFHDITRLETFGELRLTADVGELIEAASKGADLTQNGTEFTIKPPKQAYYYRQFPAGATNIYDIDIERVCPLFNENEESVLPVKIEGNKVRMQYGYFSKQEVRLANGGTMTYYYCDNLLGKYAGTVDMFFWYDEDGNRIGQNYLIHTHDDIPMLNPVPLLTKEEDVADWKGKPAAVFLGDSSQFGAAELQAKRMPSSPNTHYYDLNLMANDAAVDLKGEKVVLYLPYPEGHSENSARKLNITVGHYDDNHNLIASDVYTLENGKLQFTPYGLRLEVSSFSPYVVSWEEAAALPQTGDNFPVVLLLGMMTLSLCVMLRKRAKA